jgi:hypothetical protein
MGQSIEQPQSQRADSLWGHRRIVRVLSGVFAGFVPFAVNGALTSGSATAATKSKAKIASAAKSSTEAKPGASPSTSSKPKTRDDAMLDFARCMRKNGVDMPDPKAGANNFSLPKTSDPAKQEKALNACQSIMQAGAGTARLSQAEMADKLKVLAKCMRTNGLPDFPDPKIVNGAVSLGTTDINFDDPKVAKAMGICTKQVGIDR